MKHLRYADNNVIFRTAQISDERNDTRFFRKIYSFCSTSNNHVAVILVCCDELLLKASK